MVRVSRLLVALSLAADVALSSGGAQAKTLRWASASDTPSGDIHSQNNALANGIHAMVYESLFDHDSRSFALEPQLATGYEQPSPTQVRVTLRRGVKFHGGAAFDANDAVFSLERAMAKSSNFGVYTQGIDKVTKVDSHTIDITTKGPTPVLLRRLTELRMILETAVAPR